MPGQGLLRPPKNEAPCLPWNGELMDAGELDREMSLVRHMLANVEAGAAGDPVADQHVVRDGLALCRWHGWTPDSVVDFLALMVVGVDA